MKRKALSAIFILIFCVLSLSASHDMRLIPLSSPVYEYVEDLYILEGKAAPQGAKPWTVADLKQQLERVTPSSDVSQQLYKTIEGYMEDSDKDVALRMNLSLEPAVAAHTNKDAFNASRYWKSQVLNEKPVKLNGEFYVYDYMAASMGLSLGMANTVDSPGFGKEARFKDAYATNIPFLFAAGNIDVDITDNSYVSLGLPYISLSFGRQQLSWGNGTMGNLILSNTLPYHDYVSLNASNNTWFDYTMLMTFYHHPMNYNHGHTSRIHGIQMFVAHRFEFRMFSDRLRLTLNEATMYQSEDNTVDFRIFNPLNIMHGLYVSANANSLASLELEFAPTKNLQFYASFVIDDLSVGESKAPENDSTLNMWGIMGGLRLTYPHWKGYFTINLEGVYTSPFMYHKDAYKDDDNNYSYTMDFIGSVASMHGNDRVYNRQYLSLPFGSDALAGLLSVSYTIPQKVSAGLNLFIMAHGITDIDTEGFKYEDGVTSDYVPGILATEHPHPLSGEKGVLSYTFSIGLEAEYYILRNMSIATSIDLIHIQNMNNASGNNETDIQLTLAFKYSVF